MLNFFTAFFANPSIHNTDRLLISQDSHLHIVKWPPDVLRLIGRLLARQDAIHFTSTCVALFTLRYKAGGHGILYEQWWKRLPGPREALHSTLNLEDRARAWPEVKHYALAISALTLQFNFSPNNSLQILPIEQLKHLERLTITIPNLTALPTELGQLQYLQNLTINAFRLTTLPAELGQLQCLQNLKINANKLITLPAELGQLRNLHSLSMDVKLNYPTH